MQIKKILSKKEIEELEKLIEKNYGVKISLRDYLVFTSKEKIWIATKECAKIFSLNILINSAGLNFGKIRKGKIHLTIEGSQIVGRYASKNVVFINKNSAEKFLKGSDVKAEKEINCEYGNFVIVKSEDEILGSSLFLKDKIKNLIPKSRRTIRF